MNSLNIIYKDSIDQLVVLIDKNFFSFEIEYHDLNENQKLLLISSKLNHKIIKNDLIKLDKILKNNIDLFKDIISISSDFNFIDNGKSIFYFCYYGFFARNDLNKLFPNKDNLNNPIIIGDKVFFSLFDELPDVNLDNFVSKKFNYKISNNYVEKQKTGFISYNFNDSKINCSISSFGKMENVSYCHIKGCYDCFEVAFDNFKKKYLKKGFKIIDSDFIDKVKNERIICSKKKNKKIIFNNS